MLFLLRRIIRFVHSHFSKFRSCITFWYHWGRFTKVARIFIQIVSARWKLHIICCKLRFWDKMECTCVCILLHQTDLRHRCRAYSISLRLHITNRCLKQTWFSTFLIKSLDSSSQSFLRILMQVAVHSSFEIGIPFYIKPLFVYDSHVLVVNARIRDIAVIYPWCWSTSGCIIVIIGG